ncbi:MAG: sensor histidine kinase [Lachnospiraceae bacterium]|nr:sensor histidine kinase [Lachnospiraceae bacterium]
MNRFKNSLKRSLGKAVLMCVPCIAYNLYFLFLLPQVNRQYLFYLDFLMGVGILLFLSIDWRKEQKKQDIFIQLQKETKDLEEQLHKRWEENCELQDYIAKWCHEIKIPLTASLLMIEKIEDTSIHKGMQEQLERIRLQLNGALLGCKVQGHLFDLQIHETNLLECVKASIHNNQFFFIRNHFQIEIQTEILQEIWIYSDKAWLVYILDQLLQNAVKYRKKENGVETENPVLKIGADRKDKTVCLWVEDNGEGIKENDIRRIFDKGYTGSNYHNGQYKSTGMGLYMVSLICERLGHSIEVESKYSSYTKFTIGFEQEANLTKL